jgi:hypothetical protein
MIGIAGCAIYDSSLLVSGEADGSPDVSVDGGADVDPCNHAEPPPRPAADDPSDGGDIEIVEALRTIDFNLADDAGAFYGFDLDHTCTCPGAGSCVPLNGSSTHCDEEGGRDNAGGALVQQFSQLTTALDTSRLNQNINGGSYTMMIRVSGYNGQPNDTKVSVAVFASTGTVPLDDAGNNPTPSHDGNDQWGIDPGSVIGTPPPYVAVNQDDSAYVSGGVLVGSVAFPFSIGAAFAADFLRIDDAVLSSTLVKGPSGWTMKGVIAGRWDTRNILTGMQSVHDPFNSGQYLCGSDPTYLAFKAAICGASDISRQASNDNTGAPCDALSLAIAFESEPAKLGGLLPSGTPSEPCGSTYTDQCGP